MKKAVGAVLAACVVAFSAVPAVAAPVTKAEIARVLSGAGYSVQDFSANMLVVRSGEHKVLIALRGADADVSYITYFEGLSASDVGHDFLSRFNSEVKFGRAYIDRDGDVALQMDRNSAGGVTLGNVESDFDVFLMLISKFLSDLESRLSA